MGAKQLVYADDARQKLLAGVSKLARAVRSTLGPRGRNAVLDKGWGSPNVTKDGVTVAEEIELQDPYENMGAQLVKEAASKTSDVAGDGTTTATVLAEAVYREGLKMIAAGHDPMALTRGIQKAVDKVVAAQRRAAARLAMFKAAVAVVRGGPDKVKETKDPFGDGPFDYRAAGDGFELKSKLTYKGQPVTLTVGKGK